jgi:hypothetical protein
VTLSMTKLPKRLLPLEKLSQPAATLPPAVPSSERSEESLFDLERERGCNLREGPLPGGHGPLRSACRRELQPRIAGPNCICRSRSIRFLDSHVMAGVT